MVQGVIDLGMNMMFIASGNSNIKRVIVTSSAAPFISGKGTQGPSQEAEADRYVSLSPGVNSNCSI